MKITVNFNTLANRRRIDTLKKACKVIGTVLVSVGEVAYAVKYAGDTASNLHYYDRVDYADAIESVMKSSLWSEDKNKIAIILPRDEKSDFYRAVVKIVQSNMWSEDKVRAIKGMCKP